VASEACKSCERTRVAWSGEPWSEPSNWKSKAVTNADHFREQISTEDGLAKLLMKVHDDGIYIPFCQNKEECWDLIDENGVPEEKCMECMMQWLRKPYEGD
jgi:hypothetical protein